MHKATATTTSTTTATTTETTTATMATDTEEESTNTYAASEIHDPDMQHGTGEETEEDRQRSLRSHMTLDRIVNNMQAGRDGTHGFTEQEKREMEEEEEEQQAKGYGMYSNAPKETPRTLTQTDMHNTQHSNAPMETNMHAATSTHIHSKQHSNPPKEATETHTHTHIRVLSDDTHAPDTRMEDTAELYDAYFDDAGNHNADGDGVKTGCMCGCG